MSVSEPGADAVLELARRQLAEGIPETWSAQGPGEAATDRREPEPLCLRILAISQSPDLGDCPVITRAISLAEMCRVQLTIAAVTDPGRIVRWAGVGGAMWGAAPLDPYDWSRREAERGLLGLARSLPSGVSVRTVVMLPKTRVAVRRILDGTPHDLVVVRRELVARDLLLRRVLTRAHASVLAVEEQPSQQPLGRGVLTDSGRVTALRTT
jgi:hypothetical protein